MEGIYLLVLVIFVIFLLMVFFFVGQALTGMSKTSKEIRTKLDAASNPLYTPLSLISNFFKFLSSLTRST